MKKAYGTRARYGLLFFLTASLLAASSPALARTGEKVQLAGRWKFNPQVSDDSEQKVREALRTNRPPADGRDHTYPGGAPRGTTGYPGVGTDTQVPGGGVEVGDPQGIGRGG